MPRLEDLAIDDELPDFAFFHGVGQCVVDGCIKSHYHRTLESEKEEDKWLWSATQLHRHEERPFFRSFRVSFDPVVEAASNLRAQVVPRFRFLEELTITGPSSSDDLRTAFSGRADLSVTISTIDISQEILNTADLLVQ